MSSIAVIGFGRIGSVLTARLIGSGRRVTVHDIVPARREAVERVGARWSASIRDAVAGADVVFTVLPGAAELHQLVVSDDALLPLLGTSAVWVDLTSASFEVSRSCAQRARAAGVAFVDAPLGGGVDAVRDGTAILYLGGEAEVIDHVRDVLGVFAAQLRHVGSSSSGHLLKLLVNTVWFGQALLVTETLLVARRHGIAPEHAAELFHGSAADSAFVRDHLPVLLAGDYLADFGLARCLEELEAVETTASHADVSHPLISAVTAVHRAALAHYGPVDGELLGAAWLEQQTGARLSDAGTRSLDEADGE